MTQDDDNIWAETKQRVDLAAVGRMLGIDFQQQRDGKWKARCPWHDDDNPSLDIYVATRSDPPHPRFNCPPCGIDGDVFDLIKRRVQDVSGDGDAYDWLMDALDGDADIEIDPLGEYTPPEPEDFTERFEMFDGDPVEGLRSFYEFRPERSEIDYAWIAEEFEVRAMKHTDAIVIPQWTPKHDSLPAMRTRKAADDWFPKAYPKSQQNHLYGIWRLDPQVHDKILLVEGESDTWAASYWLREDKGWCVLGMPAGVSQRLREEWVELLKTFEVTIALDADTAGRRAAKNWVTRLADTSASGMPLRVATLPEGSDISEAGREAVERIGRHVGPRLVTDYHAKSAAIRELGGIYAHDTGDGPMRITDFTLEVEEVLHWATIHGTPEITLRVRSSLNQQVYTLDSRDLSSRGKAKEWAGRTGGQFEGSDKAAPALWAYLMTCEAPFAPNYRATSVLGWNDDAFVLPNHVLGGQTYRYLPPEDSVGGLESLDEAAVEPRTFDAMLEGALPGDILMRLVNTQTYDVSTVVMGWFAAAFARSLFIEANIGFPILHVRGRAGTGKTAMMEKMGAAFGFQITQDLAGAATKHTIKALSAATNAIPVVLDEYHGETIDTLVEKQLHSMWRTAWKAKTMRSGGSEASPRSVDSMRAGSPLAIIGEHDVSEQSLIERSVQVIVNSPNWGGTSTRGPVNPESIEPEEYAGFGRWWVNVIREELIKRSDSVIFGPFPKEPERPEHGIAVVRWGYNGLREAAKRLDVVLPEFDSQMASSRVGERREDPLLYAVSHMLHNKSGDPRETSSVKTYPLREPDGNVYINVVDFVAQCKKKGLSLPAPKGPAIAKDLESMGFDVTEMTHPEIGRVLCLRGALDDERLAGGVADEG